MKLKEIFDHLTTSELSQVSLGGSRLGEVAQSDYVKVGRLVSRGITELHKRFPLKEKTFIVEMQDGMTSYVLDMAYAQSNDDSLEPVKYIDDTADPFLNDLFKVERVYDDGVGEEQCELALNEIGNRLSLRTPNYKTLVVPADVETYTVEVVYRANHVKLTDADFADPETCEIDLPDSHLEPLLLFVAAKALNPTGFMGGNGFHEGNNYEAKYEMACLLLENQNLRVDSDVMNDRLERNGWV
jgi:hypothetical protein